MTDDTAELVSWWGLVIEGFHATHAPVTNAVDRTYGLPAAQAEVLLRLVRTPGQRLAMSRIAREVALSSGGFTKVCDRLVARGLVRRVPSDEDRRVVHAELTAAGAALADQVEALTAEAVRTHLVDVVGEDAARQLAATMRRLRDAHAPGAHAPGAHAPPPA